MGKPAQTGRNPTDTIEVTLDIAGMYYNKKVKVKSGATVEDVMIAAMNTNSPGSARLFFDPEQSGGMRYIDSIRVEHVGGSAKSRQNQSRIYEDGIYEYYDDDVDVDPTTGRLVARNSPLPYVLAWQYYVYDEAFRDLSRARVADGIARTVVPFSDSNSNGYMLGNNYTIVWRLIAIFVKPTYGKSLKVAMADKAARKG
jgi:hypothetical protein